MAMLSMFSQPPHWRLPYVLWTILTKIAYVLQSLSIDGQWPFKLEKDTPHNPLHIMNFWNNTQNLMRVLFNTHCTVLSGYYAFSIGWPKGSITFGNLCDKNKSMSHKLCEFTDKLPFHLLNSYAFTNICIMKGIRYCVIRMLQFHKLCLCIRGTGKITIQ